MSGRREDRMLRAATGLEGGLVARGSTCGVVTGGALGIALSAGPGESRHDIMGKVARYVDWFRDSFSTTLCRERTNVDFYKAKGQLLYFTPGARVARCLWHTGRAMAYISSLHQGRATARSDEEGDSGTHCAGSVLKAVREQTGIGDEALEKASFVLDGGVGLRGGVCGALAGAVLAVNIAFGWDIRDMSFPKTIKEFYTGHVNLVRRNPKGMPEPFALGKGLLKGLTDMTGSLECSLITRRPFIGPDDFQAHMESSTVCTELIRRASLDAARIILQHVRP